MITIKGQTNHINYRSNKKMPPKKAAVNIASTLLERQQQGGRGAAAVRKATIRKQQAEALARLEHQRRQRFIHEWMRLHPRVIARFGENTAVNFAIQAWVLMRRAEERAMRDPTAVPAYIRLRGIRGMGVNVD